MVKSCCVVGCKNIWTPNSCITYHQFPIKNAERLAKWMLIDQLQDIKVTQTKHICSEHFTTQSFEEHCRLKRLKKDAIPTIFGDTLYIMNDNPTETDNIKKICLSDILSENPSEVLNEVLIAEMQKASVSNKKDDPSVSMSREKNIDVSTQTSCIYFEDRKKILCLRKKVQILQHQLKRRNSRIANMQKIIHYLKKADLNKKDIYKVSRTNRSNLKEHSYCFRIT